ncbi:AAA family ATPase [Pseudoprevotella muciniphila]|uniref:AAA family ATPase n=1 Tax=Pseudoprevotella muciniphila TaxID=2133944 RepID=A0A5P8E463_9BACT|nr:AAA family ATPase [Pseudoprevotella muciniphila]QFQ11726.1 AAA family ATPase [Pseudoprevotella muciniphila]
MATTERLKVVFNHAWAYCINNRNEFLMPEHLLYVLTENDEFYTALNMFYNPKKLKERIEEFFTQIDRIPDDYDYKPQLSFQMDQLDFIAFRFQSSSGTELTDIPHYVGGILELSESWASFILRDCLDGRDAEFMSELISLVEYNNFEEKSKDEEVDQQWKRLVVCMNEHYQQQNPLIGREAELQRTIQVLCRCEKNNPLHVGEPGVGKTALIWGLAQMIEEGRVPKRLLGSRIYQLDMGTLLAGTHYRGDFENRIKQIMDGVCEEGNNNIVYIDEIHTLVGAGATSDGAMDASNMLKPYLESGNVRFIGSTTYDEYNRYFSRSKGMIRRFQQIDIPEPTSDETKHIVHQLQPRYEEFHGVKYSDEAIDFAVEMSIKHIHDRFLPDKVIDLIDEAGAAMEIGDNDSVIGKKEIADVLAKTCKVDALSEAADVDYQNLESLAPRMLEQIYGQDEAIRQVVESVQMSRAGLLDDNKPLASLLFVGPTGVGKTEVARVLARELGIELVRFDMSEYTEKHTVAKLIGSPAGYVGYEDGGLLTDAIRKSPNCVLLLDEIEKAHEDIYNILLQVMDYARLTDNKGRHADFRNVVLIMTSNAGAQYASQASVGFQSSVSRGDAMMRQVKKTFKPEFLNRLSGSVVFNDMSREMATLILQKKLRELDAKLEAKHVSMTLSTDAFDYLLKEGFTPEYGAREMDRVIAQRLKPILMREILFGSLKDGGNVTISIKDGSLQIG